MDGLPTRESYPGVVVLPADAAEVREVVRLLHLVGVPFVARGAGTGLSGGAVADPDAVLIALTRLNRILARGPGAPARVVQPGVVNARLSEAVAPHGLHYVPDPSSQTACTVGGNVAENAGGPHCLKYGVTTNHVVRARGGAARRRGRPAGLAARRAVGARPGRPVRRQRGDVRHRHRDHRAARAAAAERAHAAGRLPHRARRERGGLRGHRLGHRAGGAGDDGPGLRRGGRGVDLRRGLSDRRRGGAAGRARRPGRRGRGGGRDGRARSCASAARATVRSASSAGRPRAALAGPQEGVRRHGPHRARPRGAGRRRAPHRRCPTSWTGSPRSATGTGSRISNVFHAGDGNLHPNISFDRRDPRPRPTGCTSPAGRSWRPASRPAAASPASTASAPTRSTTCRWIFDAETLGAMRAVRRVFDPAERANPGKVVPLHACREWRAAPGVAMSDDVVFGRLRALLGTQRRGARSRRRARGPRPRPPTRSRWSAGWRTRRAGRSGSRARRTWLPPDAPADLAVSTRALDQVVSVSPADLVATVQAGAPLEALRRRLADEGMWLALDPPGRPERSLGSVVATATAGPLRQGFGPVRDHVLGCTVATGDGRLVKAGGRVVKNVAGLRSHQAPGRRLRRVRDHRRAASPAPRPAAGRRDPGGARRARRAHLRRARPDRRRAHAGGARAALARPGGRGGLGAGGALPRHRRRGAGRRAPARRRSASSPGSRSPPDARRPSGAWWRAAARAGRSRSGSASWATAWTRRIDLLAHDLDEGLLARGRRARA